VSVKTVKFVCVVCVCVCVCVFLKFFVFLFVVVCFWVFASKTEMTTRVE